MPFILALFFLLWQQDIIFPIIGGLIIGSILLSRFNPLLGFFHTAGDIIIIALTDSSNLLTIVLIVECLILFALLNKCGFISTFTRELSKKSFTKNTLESIIFFSSLALFIDRYFSTIFTGIFTRPFAERKKLSPYKHAYLLNTVSSSAATIIPFTTLTPLTIAVIGTSFQSLGIEFSPVRAFYLSLPYHFYSIFSLFTALAIVILKKDIFLMKKYQSITPEPIVSFGLQVGSKKKSKTRLSLYGVTGSFIIIFASIILGLIFAHRTHGGFLAGNVLNFQITFINALFVGIVFTIIYAAASGSVNYNQWKTNNETLSGTPVFTFLFIILSLSVVVLAEKLGFQSALMAILLNKSIAVKVIPLLIFFLSSVFSFLSGSSRLTIAAVMPLALKIASFNMSDPLLVDTFIFATIASVLSGAAFGDLNSPFSLNFILSTASSNSSVRGHFNSQIVYSLIAFSAAVVFGYSLFMLGVTPYVSISSGFLVIAASIVLFSRSGK